MIQTDICASINLFLFQLLTLSSMLAYNIYVKHGSDPGVEAQFHFYFLNVSVY